MKRLASAPLPPPTIEEAERGIESDRVAPVDEAAARFMTGNRPKDVEEDLLHRILRVGTRPEEAIGTAEDRRRMALDELLVGSRPVGQLTPRTFDEFSVRILVR
jgi:hypothetical protein